MNTLDFHDHIKMGKPPDYFTIIKVQRLHDTMTIAITQGYIFSSTNYYLGHMQTGMIHINMSTTKILHTYSNII